MKDAPVVGEDIGAEWVLLGVPTPATCTARTHLAGPGPESGNPLEDCPVERVGVGRPEDQHAPVRFWQAFNEGTARDAPDGVGVAAHHDSGDGRPGDPLPGGVGQGAVAEGARLARGATTSGHQ